MWDLLRTFKCIYIISSGKILFYLEKQEMQLKWERVFYFYGLRPYVMFSKPGSWRRIDLSQHKERSEEFKVLPWFPGSDRHPSREVCSDETGWLVHQSDRKDTSVLQHATMH